MSDRHCIRGCVRHGEHYAACRFSGPDYVGPFPCDGCAPRECRDGSLVCDRCFGRMRALLADGPDLIGRVRSLADPMKATPMDKAPGGRSSATEPPAPIDADLIDALTVLDRLEPWWHVALSDYSNDLEVMTWLGQVVLDRHAEVEGLRDGWSVADAMAKWGPERRTTNGAEWMDDISGEEVAAIPEWGDQLLNRLEADREAGSASTLRRWLQRELIAPVGTVYIAGRRTTLFRRSELRRVKAAQEEKQHAGRPRANSRGEGP